MAEAGESSGRVYKHAGDQRWEGLARQEYKSPAHHWQGVSRTEIVAENPRPTLPFHVRYFEIEPGGFSSRERHDHEHVVMIVRGQGTVWLGSASKDICEGDVVHVGPGETHQFLADRGDRLGFYCIVPAERDRPVVEGGGASACEIPPTRAKSP